MNLLSRLLPRVGLVAAIPFLAGVASDHVVVETTVHPQGTGLRRVMVAVAPTRFTPVRTDLRLAYPDWNHSSRGQEHLRVEKVIDPPDAIEGVSIKVSGSPLSPTRDYTFEETVSVSDSLSTDKDEKIREQAPVEYKVIMPAAVTEAPGAEIEGRTATFRLSLADDAREITVKARGVQFMPAVMLLFVLLAVVVGLLNLFIPSSQRRQARNVEAEGPAEMPDSVLEE